MIEMVEHIIRRKYKCGKTNGHLKINRYTVYYTKAVREFFSYSELPCTVQKFLRTHFAEEPESYLDNGDQIWIYRYHSESVINEKEK